MNSSEEMQMDKLKPLIVDVSRVKPLSFGESYDSRMILDHVITGREGVIQMNHGTVKPHCKLGGATHEEDEIYYILSGNGFLQLDEERTEVHAGEVVFIPAGCFHALDNSDSDEPLTILTLWKDYRYNDAYAKRLKLWGTSFRTVDDEE